MWCRLAEAEQSTGGHHPSLPVNPVTAVWGSFQIAAKMKMEPWMWESPDVYEFCLSTIGSILNPLAANFSEDTRKKGKGAKTGAPHDWRSFYMSQYDWLNGSHMTKVIWLPNETDYSYCEFVAPNTPYYLHDAVVLFYGVMFSSWIVHEKLLFL